MSFGNCLNLQSITFLGRVDTINRMAFHHCENLREIRIPRGSKRHYRRVLDRNQLSELKEKLVETKTR